MKKLAAALFALGTVVFPCGETWAAEPLKLSADSNLTLTQNSYSSNWTGSEAGSFSWTVNALLTAEKQFSKSLQNKNTLKASYGKTHNQDRSSKEWADPVTSTDLLDIESVLRVTREWLVDPYISVRLESKYFDSSDTAYLRYINPATLTESIGAALTLMKTGKREWQLRLGAAGKQNVIHGVLDPSAGTRGSDISNSGGIQFVSNFVSSLLGDNITVISNTTLYQALVNSRTGQVLPPGQEELWKSPDMNWENIFTAGITKYIMVNLYLQLLYDRELASDIRIKETVAMGLTYRFSN